MVSIFFALFSMTHIYQFYILNLTITLVKLIGYICFFISTTDISILISLFNLTDLQIGSATSQATTLTTGKPFHHCFSLFLCFDWILSHPTALFIWTFRVHCNIFFMSWHIFVLHFTQASNFILLIHCFLSTPQNFTSFFCFQLSLPIYLSILTSFCSYLV